MNRYAAGAKALRCGGGPNLALAAAGARPATGTGGTLARRASLAVGAGGGAAGDETGRHDPEHAVALELAGELAVQDLERRRDHAATVGVDGGQLDARPGGGGDVVEASHHQLVRHLEAELAPRGLEEADRHQVVGAE